ncbi:MAG: histidine--tRNA ligase [Spirochaetaceae bacterium]|jgi:histidyl-tRNA synthetase|nr:histidine--tRNA ligase [Spirochaetaceae bacterium]
MATFIEPKILKGFRDFLPAGEIARRGLVERMEACFRSFGFVPIDTPALEYAEILLGKGGGETEKQIYRFKDNGNRDVALRFDLTVPFARFVAEHRGELSLPFKRYHIAKVWRGENTQRGRYREFTQCDFDIVGSDSPAADFEILLMMKQTFQSLGIGNITIRINHRGIFNRFLERLGLRDRSADILRTVDKLGKIGRDETLRLLSESAGNAAQTILGYIETAGTFEEILRSITEASGGESPESRRIARIRRFMDDTGIADSFVLDPSITRGLDYYTGVVYETFLNDLPDIGSVCSGGRYDNLTGLYAKESLGGVGSSVGLDRLIAALEALGKGETASSYSKIAVACVKEEDGGLYQTLAGRLRTAGIPCEAFLEEAKLAKQCVLAEKKGAQWLIIPGARPLTDPLALRNLKKRENQEGLSLDDIIQILRA